MQVYQLSFVAGPRDTESPPGFIDLREVGLVKVNGSSINGSGSVSKGMEVDWDYMLYKYSFRLTPEEVACFNVHKYAWKMFLSGSAPWCLIIEDAAVPDILFSEMVSRVNDLAPGWDVFCPFDKSKIASWGSYAYFISRKGAARLLKIPRIRQPVDEEIFQLTLEGLIDTRVSEISFIHYRETPGNSIKSQREQAMREVLRGMNVWTPDRKEHVRTLLRTLSGIARETQCELVLDSGTLLGHVRHNGIMPWDDDVDLGMDKMHFERFIGKVRNTEGLKWKRCSWPINQSFYYKIWDMKGEKIDGFDYNFPFIDIWLFVRKNENPIEFEEGRVFENEIFFPLKEVQFEGAGFFAPNDPIKCLNIQYHDWKDNIVVYPWSHRLERSAFPPVKLPIHTDNEGRLLDY